MGLSCRAIVDADLATVVDLLCEGFPARTRRYWQQGVRRLADQAAAQDAMARGLPRLGYLMVAGGDAVGVLLLIHADPSAGIAARTNISSWYVRPEFRAFGALMVSRAVRGDATRFVNVSPAPHTLATIEAQGFAEVYVGCFAGVPLVSRARPGVRVSVLRDGGDPVAGMSAAEATLLGDHARFGCLTLWLQTHDGGHPFIFRRRTLQFGRVPCAMLIHAPSLETLERFAGPLGRVLARHGMPLLLAAADRPLRGIVGKHFPAKLAIYATGAPVAGTPDLSYTEAAVFGM